MIFQNGGAHQSMGELKTSQLFTWGQQLLKRVWDDKSTEIINCAIVGLILIL